MLFQSKDRVVIDICVIRSMVGDSLQHGGAVLQLHTGSNTFTRPSLGSWLLFGLGNENHDLPGYININPALYQHGGAKNWSSSFLPSAYQGMAIGNDRLKMDDLGEPIEYLRNNQLTPEQQRYELDMLQNMNRQHALVRQNEPELEGRIDAFELTYFYGGRNFRLTDVAGQVAFRIIA